MEQPALTDAELVAEIFALIKRAQGAQPKEPETRARDATHEAAPVTLDEATSPAPIKPVVARVTDERSTSAPPKRKRPVQAAPDAPAAESAGEGVNDEARLRSDPDYAVDTVIDLRLLYDAMQAKIEQMRKGDAHSGAELAVDSDVMTDESRIRTDPDYAVDTVRSLRVMHCTQTARIKQLCVKHVLRAHK